MKFTLATLLTTLTTLTTATTVSFDPGYDQKSRSMTAVSCSDGANGLITRYGWQTQGAIPKFPYIGGSSDIAGWNSAQCGQCYAVTYKGKTIHMLAIDHAGAGINMSEEAFKALTGNTALGRIDATVTKVGYQQCGLAHGKREVEFTA